VLSFANPAPLVIGSLRVTLYLAIADYSKLTAVWAITNSRPVQGDGHYGAGWHGLLPAGVNVAGFERAALSASGVVSIATAPLGPADRELRGHAA
jgi:hypothetical protein